MLLIHGKILNVVFSENRDKNTGEIRKITQVEILHISKGRNVIDNLKIDLSVANEWQKAIGKDITAEVAVYAIKAEDGSLVHGFSLADKKSLPTVQTKQNHLAAA